MAQVVDVGEAGGVVINDLDDMNNEVMSENIFVEENAVEAELQEMSPAKTNEVMSENNFDVEENACGDEQLVAGEEDSCVFPQEEPLFKEVINAYFHTFLVCQKLTFKYNYSLSIQLNKILLIIISFSAFHISSKFTI